MQREEARKVITEFVAEILKQENLPAPENLNDQSVLFGSGGAMDSMTLVELMLKLEDYCASAGIQFVWTNDSAMSQRNSNYNTIGSLVEFLVSLAEKK